MYSKQERFLYGKIEILSLYDTILSSTKKLKNVEILFLNFKYLYKKCQKPVFK